MSSTPHSTQHKRPCKYRPIAYRPINDVKIMLFKRLAEETNWSGVFQLFNPIPAYNLLKKKRFMRKPFLQWNLERTRNQESLQLMSHFLKNLNNVIRSTHFFLIKTGRPEYLAEFKKIRNKLGFKTKRARTIYCQNKFSDIFY